MLSTHHDLMKTIETVHDIIREAKQLKNAVVLRNLTGFRPIMYNRTCWSGKVYTLQMIDNIRDEHIDKSNSADGIVTVYRSTRFAKKVRKHSKLLVEIDLITRSRPNSRTHTFLLSQ